MEAFSAGPNQGSEFVVHLPALAEPPPPTNGTARTPGKHRLCRVLVVDDNEDAARSLSMLLEMNGHQVRTCHDGQSALDTAEEFGPEVVLLDIGLPGMDGYEVARRLRERPAAQPLLVALSGYGQAEDQRRSREAGFDHHLVKPAEPEALTALFASLPAQHRDPVPTP